MNDKPEKECGRWKTEINVLWKTIGKKLGWKHRRSKKISELLREEKETGAILQFLRDTDIGKIKNGVSRPPIPDCDGDGESVTSEGERKRGCYGGFLFNTIRGRGGAAGEVLEAERERTGR